MRFIVLIYALAILLGGIAGHAQSGSAASLISGIVFGVLLLGAAAAMFCKKPWGAYCALVLAFVLDGFFTWRYLHTLKFFPPGLFSLVSLAVVVALALSIRRK